MTARLIPNPPPGLRDRLRADGSWRVWWEPSARQRAAGALVAELRADNLGWSVVEARRLTKAADARARGETASTTQGRSVSAVIQDYLGSRWFTGLAANTKRVYRSDLRAVEDKWGPQPIAAIDPPVMDAWYEALLAAKGQFRSRAVITMFRVIFTHAERRGWRPKGSNPCADLGMKKPPGRSRKGTWDEMEAALHAARHLGLWGVHLALLLAIFSGQRLTDILQAQPADFTALAMLVPGRTDPVPVWIWALTRNKIGNAGLIPMHREVVPALRLARLMAARGPGALIWDAATGRAYDLDLIAKRWARVRALAAVTVPSIASLQWRDLRRTFAGLARQGGASRDDVGETIGNTAATNAELGAVYMSPQLATTARAVRAITRPKQA